MGTTLNTFRTQLRTALSNRSDEPDVNIDRWINGGYIWLAAHIRPFELEKKKQFTLGVNKRILQIGSGLDIDISDFFSIYSIRNETTGRKLTPSSIRQLDALQHPNTQATTPTQEPTRYARFAKEIQFDHTSDASYTMLFRYNSRPVKLTTITSEVATEAEWDEVILNNALWRAKSELNFPVEERDAVLKLNSIIVNSIRRRWQEEGDDVEMGVTPVIDQVG